MAGVDERRELTEVENGSIMSVGRLTSDILERPISEKNKDSTSVKDAECSSVHAHTHTHTHAHTHTHTHTHTHKLRGKAVKCQNR